MLAILPDTAVKCTSISISITAVVESSVGVLRRKTTKPRDAQHLYIKIRGKEGHPFQLPTSPNINGRYETYSSVGPRDHEKICTACCDSPIVFLFQHLLATRVRAFARQQELFTVVINVCKQVIPNVRHVDPAARVLCLRRLLCGMCQACAGRLRWAEKRGFM